MPIQTQIAPVFGMQSGDYDGDGHLDLLMVGNWHAPTLRTGQADAFVGAYLRGDGTGHFTVVNGTESGFFVDGDAKALVEVGNDADSSLLVTSQNDGPLKAFRSPPLSDRSVPLEPTDQRARLTFEDGSTRKQELYYGSTYLSQSSRVLKIPPGVTRVEIYKSTGDQRTAPVDDLLPSAKATE